MRASLDFSLVDTGLQRWEMHQLFVDSLASYVAVHGEAANLLSFGNSTAVIPSGSLARVGKYQSLQTVGTRLFSCHRPLDRPRHLFISFHPVLLSVLRVQKRCQVPFWLYR